MASLHQPTALRHSKSVDTFQFGTPSDAPPFSFSLPFHSAPSSPVPYGLLKRDRALSDVDYDGSGDEGRKKRRLRLHLITSRLSRPFSAPASNVRCATAPRSVGQARKCLQKSTRSGGFGGFWLRKAAILNRIKLRMDATREYWRLCSERREREEMEWKKVMMERQNQKVEEFVLPPSPLGRSDYDALDLEDEDMLDLNDGGETEIKSDFNVMMPARSDGEDHTGDCDYLDAIDGLSSGDLPDQPPTSLQEGIVDMLKEKERAHDGCFEQREGTGTGL